MPQVCHELILLYYQSAVLLQLPVYHMQQHISCVWEFINRTANFIFKQNVTVSQRMAGIIPPTCSLVSPEAARSA